MWERYGFYTVQTLIVLYLTVHFSWNDDSAYHLVGAFTALTYLAPVAGGYLADKFMGQRRAIFIGFFFLSIGYAILSSGLNLIHGLSCIAVGTGFLKPNISSLLGNEYKASSPLRESGFTLFYLGITSGIILGTILPSHLLENYSWSLTFGSAVIGILVAFITFSFGCIKYKIKDFNAIKFDLKSLGITILITLALYFICFLLLYSEKLANISFLIITVLSIAYLTIIIIYEERHQAKKTLTIALLCVISTIFFAFYFQMFTSITLFIDRCVSQTLWGFDFPHPYYITIQSLTMVIFGFWTVKNNPRLTLKERANSISNKFFLALILLLLAYFNIYIIALMAVQKINPLFLFPAFILIGIGELILSPVGLSAITILAAREKVSTLMGVFFVSLGLGAYLSGKLAIITSWHGKQQLTNVLLKHYSTSFGELLLILFGATLLSLFILLGLKKVINKY